jgi:hypothetical protein
MRDQKVESGIEVVKVAR